MLKRYEGDPQSLGAKLTGKCVPIAVGLGQGRAFSVERSVEAAKRPKGTFELVSWLNALSTRFVIRAGQIDRTIQTDDGEICPTQTPNTGARLPVAERRVPGAVTAGGDASASRPSVQAP